MSKTEIEKSAYHEAGHIVFAYLHGYRCVGVFIKPNGSGTTGLDYGTDKELMQAIQVNVTNSAPYNLLPIDQKRRTSEVGVKMLEITLAGEITETILMDEGKIDPKSLIALQGPDLDDVLAVEQLFKDLKFHNDPHFIARHTKAVQAKIEMLNLWPVIEALANSILTEPDNMLEQQDIEDVFSSTGFQY